MHYDPSFPALCDHYPPPASWAPWMVGYISAEASDDAVAYFEEFHRHRLVGTTRVFNRTGFRLEYWLLPKEEPNQPRRDDEGAR